MSKQKNNIKDQLVSIGSLLSALCIVLLIISLIIWNNDNLKSLEPVETLESKYDKRMKLSNARNRASVRNALRGVISKFKVEDLMNANIVIDYKKAKKPVEYIHVRLRDGALIPIGYYDDNGFFITILKNKD